MLAALVRSGMIEATHEGAVAVVEADGSLVASSGDIDRPFFYRSASKPFQAAACLRFGFDPPPEHLAVASGSHPGEPVHLAIVEEILRRAGLGSEALGCPADWPLGDDARRRLMAAGESEQPLFHNCSGKHAAWLATAVINGWDTGSYLDPAHPLQRGISDLMAGLGGPGAQIGVDGCGAPVHPTTTRILAQAFARLAGDAEFERVFGAMHTYPALVARAGSADLLVSTWLHAAAKGGAEGCIGVGLKAGLGVGVKCWDGSGQAAGVGAIAALDQLGQVGEVARPHLEVAARPRVMGGGSVVGAVEPRLELQWA